MLRRVLDSDSSLAILVGHSMGGVVAMQAAAAAPSQVTGLVLSSPFLPVGRYGRSTLVTATDYARHRLLFIAGANRRRRLARPPGANLRVRAASLRSLARYGLRPGAFHAEASQVRCPTLLIHGSLDHYVPPGFALAAAKRHPTWQLRMLDNAGHFPHRDNPLAWLAVVEPWLDYQDTARLT
jgi:pimeloyl-ACP methyl ester carboxylesterase